MADEIERVKLEIDDSDSVKVQSRFNSNMTSMESHAGRVSEAATRAVESESRRIITISQTSQNTINRIVAAAQKKAALASGGPTAQLNAEFNRDLKRVSGDSAAVDKLTKSYQTLLGVQRQINEEARRAVVTEASRRTATSTERIVLDRTAAVTKLTSLGGSKAEIAAVSASFDKLLSKEHEVQNFGARIKEFIENPTRTIGHTIEETGAKFGKFGVLAGGALVAVGVAAYEAFDILKESASAAEGIQQLSDRLGVTVEQGERLADMAKIVNVDIGSVEGAMRRLSEALINGGQEGKKGAEALQDIRVSARSSNGELKGTYELFQEISKAVSGLDAATRTTKLSAIFGRGSITLAPLFADFEKNNKALDELGIKLDEKLIHRLNAADDEIDLLGIQWERLKSKLAGGILATIEFAGGGTKVLQGLAFGLGAIPGAIVAAATTQIPTPPRAAYETSYQGPFAKRVEDAAVARGDKILANFKARMDTAAGIQSEITRLEQKTREDEAKLQPGLRGDIQQKQVNVVTADRAATDSLKERLKLLTEIPARIKQAQDYAASAARIESTGVARVIDEYKAKHAALTEGIKDAAALAQINKSLSAGAQTQIKVESDKAQLKAARETIAATEQAFKDRVRYEEEILNRTQTYQAETLRIKQDTIRSEFAYEETEAGQSRDRQLRALELSGAETIQQKIAIENQKSGIEAQFLQTQSQARLDADRRAAELEAVLLKASLDAGVVARKDYDDRIHALVVDSATREKQIRLSTEADIQKVREEAAIRNANLIRDANTRVFDSFKQQAGGVFDALLNKGQSVFAAIGSIFKNTLLTGVKDIFSTQIARTLTGLYTGKPVGLTPGGGTGSGPLASLFGALGLGARPVFGPDSGSGIAGIKPINGAMPVVVLNPGDIAGGGGIGGSSTISSSTSSTSNFTIGGLIRSATGGFAAAGRTASLAGALGASILSGAATPGFINGPGGPGDFGLGLGGGFAPYYQGGSAGAGSSSSPLASPLAQALVNSESLGLGPIGGGRSIPSLFNLSGAVYSGGAGTSAGGSSTAGGRGILGGLASMLGFGGNPEYRGGAYNVSGPGGGVWPELGSGGIPGGVSGPSGGSGGGIGGILGNLGIGGGGLGSIFNKGGIILGAGHGTTAAGIGGVLGGLAGFATSPAGLALGTSLLLGSLSTKNPKSVFAAVGAGAGGALAGFNIGSKIPGLGGINGALIGGGAGLFIQGYQRGGVGGALQQVAGGAIAGYGIGSKFGGPVGGLIGAAIGAGVGAITGTLRATGILSSATERAHDKIQAIYGVDIGDFKILTQIVGISKQSYGGNIDAAIRGPETRSLIELYAQIHGQNARGIVNRAQSAQFSNEGGKFNALDTYFNGQAVRPGDTRSTVGSSILAPGVPGGYAYSPVTQGANTVGGGGTTTLSLDAEATRALLQGQAAQVIAGSPRLVAGAASSGMEQSASRRQVATNVLSPNFVTS